MLAKNLEIHHNMNMKQTKRLYTLITTFLLVLAATTLALAANAPVQFSAEPFISASQDNAIVIKMQITPDAEYHFYSRQQGDTGKPTSIAVSPSPVGTTVRYPAGVKSPDPILKNKTTYLYEGAEEFYITIPDAKAGKADLTVSLLLCSNVRCAPVRKSIPVTWKTAALTEAETQPWWKQYSAITPVAPDAAVRSSIPSSSKNADLAKKLGVQLPSSSGSGKSLSSSLHGKISSLGGTTSSETSVSLMPKRNLAPKHEYEFTPRYFLKALEVSTLGKAILFGLIAGFILNFMPCVLPVISLKLSSLVAAAQITDDQHRKHMFREHNLYFALGILTWFSLLTIVLTSFGLAWGQLFQNENLLIGLTILIFVLALSIFDIFPLPMFSLTGRGTQNGNDKWSAYSTGLLSTVLATPCSGPFLGGVLGWAFLQPVGILVIIFLSVGLGMALPYLAMAVVPDLINRFPRPGAWTGTLSHIVGFFLMGTVVYMLYVLPIEILPDMLVVLWASAIAAWAWGRFSGLSFSRKRNIIVRSICALFVILTMFVALKEEPQAKRWNAFTPELFFTELKNKRIIVDFTADWCPNCKVLERTVLTPENRLRWEEKYNVIFVKVDLTKEDAEKQQFLEALGSNSIPVVAIFPKGEKAHSPVVLRDIFTSGQMEDALREAFK